ncbi:unnamed protein product, partial [Brassica napus]
LFVSFSREAINYILPYRTYLHYFFTIENSETKQNICKYCTKKGIGFLREFLIAFSSSDQIFHQHNPSEQQLHPPIIFLSYSHTKRCVLRSTK